MKNVKLSSAVVLAIILVVGVLAMSAQAAKGGPKGPKEEPVLDYVTVWGGIEGNCENSADISIKLSDVSFGSHAGSFVANPDYPPALKVGGPGKNKRLTYYYCDHESHTPGSDDLNTICAVDEHNPEHYRQLVISNGQFDRKTGITVFPAGSTWAIVKKVINDEDGSWSGQRVAQGTLGQDVTYQEVYLP